MTYDLSIIVAHFKPENLLDNPLLKTINKINQQKKEYKVEVTISDDGSFYNHSFLDNYSRIEKIDNKSIYILENKELKDFLIKQNLKVDGITKWIHFPKINNSMNKAFVTNCGVSLSQSDKLLFLDDDNYFISSNSANNAIELFNEYDFIAGQIKDNNGRLRSFSSNRVQGTTIGMKKNILFDIGGFGEWTEEYSCGIDSDLWIKLYNYFNSNKNLKACYTNRVCTYDSHSKRWGKFTKIFKEWNIRKKFKELYDCQNYKKAYYNPSRQKNKWIKNLIDE